MVRTGWEVVAVAFRGRIGWFGRNRNSANDVNREANFLLVSQIVLCEGFTIIYYLFIYYIRFQTIAAISCKLLKVGGWCEC